MAATQKRIEHRLLVLAALADGCPGLTPEKGATFAQASSVCLEYNSHPTETSMRMTGSYDGSCTLVRVAVSDQIRRTHRDLQEATEDGATGIAILAVRHCTGLTVVERKSKVGGFDWYLGNEPKDEFSLLDRVARLEVSGILTGDDSLISSRVKQKLKQTNPSDASGLPAYIAVVEFGGPECRMVMK